MHTHTHTQSQRRANFLSETITGLQTLRAVMYVYVCFGSQRDTGAMQSLQPRKTRGREYI